MTTWHLEAVLAQRSHTWLVTGAAGFIGSHLVEALLAAGQQVIGFDNLATGHRRNLHDAVARAGVGASARWRFVEGDLVSLEDCERACVGVDFVLHQAALGSVPRSLKDPLATHRSNVDGFLNLLVAARDAKVKRFVFASSSSVYGDHPVLPKVEAQVGRVLSPYAATKHINEVYAGVFQRCYGLPTVGLRYFNVFGPRQDPEGAYAAVIPRWLVALAKGEPCEINGDGSTSRDFCFVANAVQANLRAALATHPQATDSVYNIALGGRISLLEMYGLIRQRLATNWPHLTTLEPRFAPFRDGDIKDSQADTALAVERLGYAPTHTVAQGLDETVRYFLEHR